jgi:hypothetical protein
LEHLHLSQGKHRNSIYQVQDFDQQQIYTISPAQPDGQCFLQVKASHDSSGRLATGIRAPVRKEQRETWSRWFQKAIADHCS